MFKLVLILISLFHLSCSSSERVIEVPGAALFCKQLGEGKPLIVLHGGPGLSQEYLLPHLERLAKNNCVIFYDQRCGGSSTGEINAENLTIDLLVEDIEAIRKAYGYERISILGHSFGGLLALHYAIKHPESIDKLILVDSMPASSRELFPFMKEWVTRVGPSQAALQKIQTSEEYKNNDPQAYKEYYTTLFRPYCYLPSSIDRINFQMSSKACENSMKIYEIVAKPLYLMPYNLHKQLDGLKVDALIVHGSNDIIPQSAAENIHSSLSGSKYISFPQCGHFPFVEKEELFFSLTDQFLAGS